MSARRFGAAPPASRWRWPSTSGCSWCCSRSAGSRPRRRSRRMLWWSISCPNRTAPRRGRNPELLRSPLPAPRPSRRRRSSRRRSCSRSGRRSVPPTRRKQSWVEMSKDEMAAADLGNLPKAGAGRQRGDCEVVGTGPHGETLYRGGMGAPPDRRRARRLSAQEFARRVRPDCLPNHSGQPRRGLHRDWPDARSRLAPAVRQAAWQFRVRPPRKGGKPLIGSWVQIRIDYEHIVRSSAGL